jgi:exosortase E/protease (VPEID-CTERM system)
VDRPFYVLAVRVSILAVLFAGEALLATLFLDGAAPVPRGSWLAASIHSWGPQVARFAIAFSALFLTFTFLRFKKELRSVSASVREAPRPGLLVAHFAAIALFATASMSVYGDRLPGVDPNLAAIVWIVAAISAVAFAALAILPWNFWISVAGITRSLWIFVAAGAFLTTAGATMFRSLWKPASTATFQMVRVLLSAFVRDMVIQPDRLRIGTHRFTVIIADECSGLEGIGLLLVFGLMWLLVFRNEARFPHALVLLPLGIVTLFLLNAVRITALILIGNAGAREIAMGGFHSQAGWIAFNSVAFGSSIVARRWSWISTRPHLPRAAEPAMEAADSTGAFLVPFLAILAAGMVSRAASGAFEWLYPLRFVTALAALWLFRRSYSKLDWNWSILAPATGAAVFLVWIAADRFAGNSLPMPAPLATADAWVRGAWIAFRVLGAVFTVPVAEELAFRGFLLRRFTGADFEKISFRSVTWIAVVGSSLLFGLMNGGRWWLGTIAGIAYALLIRRTGRIGDAAVAHSFTNALLAAYVLAFGQWQLW